MRISVVIPCYNGAGFLAEALASVRRQTRAPDELLVVDDGSTDDSVALARRTGATVLGTGTNGGPARARNVGIAQASGDVVAFLDADDLWHHDHLATVERAFVAVPVVGVVYTGVRDTRGWMIAATTQDPEHVPLDLRWRLLRGNPIAQSAAAARTRVLREVGGYDERARHAEDYDLWIRLARTTTFACAHAITATYRRHAAQTTQDFATMRRAAWNVRLQAAETLAAAGPAERARVQGTLLEAWEAELAGEWRARCTDNLDVVLGLRALVPGSASAYARWQRRRRWLWWPELAGHVLLQWLPRSWRRLVKPRASFARA